MNKRRQANVPEPLMEVVEVRVVLAKGMKSLFLHDLGDWGEGDVFGFTELQNDGFGRLVPRGQADVFLSEPQEQEVQRALETGEV